MVKSIPEKNESEGLNETGTVEDKLILKQLELLEYIHPLQSDLQRLVENKVEVEENNQGNG